MPRLQSVDTDTLTPTTRQQLHTITGGGPIADVYRQLANSDSALSAYLSMEAALQESTRLNRLSAREVEAVKLLVSALTQCEFCLSIHTAKAGRVGLGPDLQLAIRRGDSVAEAQSASPADSRLDCLLRMVRQLFTVPGALPQPLLDEARTLGISDAALVDLCLAMSTIFFTNISNHINHTESPLPPAPTLEAATGPASAPATHSNSNTASNSAQP